MLISSTFNICEICGKPRSNGKHRKCSRILQKRSLTPEYQEEQRKILNNVRGYELNRSVSKNVSARLRVSKRGSYD